MSKRNTNTLTLSYRTKDKIWMETLYVVKNKPSDFSYRFAIFDFYQIIDNQGNNIVVRKKVSLKFINGCGSVYGRYGINKIYFKEDITLDQLAKRVLGGYLEEVDEDTRNKVYEFLKKQLKTIKKWKILKKLFKHI